MRQLIDFTGLELEGGIYPTDIDGLIEYHNQEYILIEVKYGKTKVPFGQRLAIERMVDDFTKIGKPAVAIVCEHTVKDADKHVVAAACRLINKTFLDRIKGYLSDGEIYYGGEHRWKKTEKQMTVREFIDNFQSFLTEKEGLVECK